MKTVRTFQCGKMQWKTNDSEEVRDNGVEQGIVEYGDFPVGEKGDYKIVVAVDIETAKSQ